MFYFTIGLIAAAAFLGYAIAIQYPRAKKAYEEKRKNERYSSSEYDPSAFIFKSAGVAFAIFVAYPIVGLVVGFYLLFKKFGPKE